MDLVRASPLGLEVVVDRPNVVFHAAHRFLGDWKRRAILDTIEAHLTPIERLFSLCPEVHSHLFDLPIIGNIGTYARIL